MADAKERVQIEIRLSLPDDMVREATAHGLLEPASDVLSRFDRAMARLAERNAGFSDEEVAADVAAARDELPG